MFKTIKSEFQCFKAQGGNSNVYKKKVQIPMFEKIKSEFQCLKEQGAHSYAWKKKVPIPMLRKIRCDFKCLAGYGFNSGQNFNVSKDKVGIPVFRRTR